METLDCMELIEILANQKYCFLILWVQMKWKNGTKNRPKVLDKFQTP